MSAEAPLVSVVIPCFNAAATIGRALASVRAQSWSPLEIVVVDDGSTDGTAERLAAEPGLRLVRMKRQSGAAAARNAGIEAAKGDFIAFLDADDEWLPEKLARQMPVILAAKAMTFVACGAKFVRLDGSLQEDLYGDLAPATGAEAWRVLLAYNFVATPAVIARRAALEAVGGFDTSLVVAEDQDLWIRLALAGEVGYVRENLLIVHARANSLSYARTGLSDLEYGLPMVLRHLAAQRHRLTPRDVRSILGHRYTKLGRNAYAVQPARGLPILLKAIGFGHAPLANLAFILRASPAAKWVKRQLRSQ